MHETGVLDFASECIWVLDFCFVSLDGVVCYFFGPCPCEKPLLFEFIYLFACCAMICF